MITQAVSAIPLMMHRDEVISFPSDQNLFVSKAEATFDHLSLNTVIELNTLVTQINAEKDIMIEASQYTLGYRDTSKIYRDESLAYRNTTLSYKTAAETAYTNTANLVNNLVIPTDATYSYAGANARFSKKIEKFINFNIGE